MSGTLAGFRTKNRDGFYYEIQRLPRSLEKGREVHLIMQGTTTNYLRGGEFDQRVCLV